MKEEVISSIMYILVGGLLLNGCVHSCKKHKDDPSWLQDTPAVMYRGVEYFWHDDFAGVDWNERLESDVRTAIILMDNFSSKEKADENAKQIEEFSKKIQAYPKDKFRYIKNASATYIRFTKTTTDDVTSYIEALKNNTTLVSGKGWNENARPYADSIIYIYKYTEMAEQNKYLDSLVTTSGQNIDNLSNADIDRGKANLKMTSAALQSAYKILFKEEFK